MLKASDKHKLADFEICDATHICPDLLSDLISSTVNNITFGYQRSAKCEFSPQDIVFLQ